MELAIQVSERVHRAEVMAGDALGRARCAGCEQKVSEIGSPRLAR